LKGLKSVRPESSERAGKFLSSSSLHIFTVLGKGNPKVVGKRSFRRWTKKNGHRSCPNYERRDFKTERKKSTGKTILFRC